ncbi:hypothetical protein Tco_0569622 [Tanacetum coccineum]
MLPLTFEEIFSSEAWRRAFDINEPIYTELCHEFYSTYEFDEFNFARVCSTFGLYHSDEVNEKGFNVYFQGGLRGNENFNTRDYWLSISSADELHLTIGYDKVQRNELWLMSMFEAKHQNDYANVAWLMAKWLKRKGVRSQKDSMICCGQLITKMAKKMRVLTDEVLNSLSAPTYCRALDTTTLRELIDSEGRLIPEVPAPGVLRVAIPRGPRPSMQDLYDRMRSMEIRQRAIERMTYRQSYH